MQDPAGPKPNLDAAPGSRAALLLLCEVLCLLFLYGFIVAAACPVDDPGGHSTTPSVLAVGNRPPKPVPLRQGSGF